MPIVDLHACVHVGAAVSCRDLRRLSFVRMLCAFLDPLIMWLAVIHFFAFFLSN